MFTRCIHCCEDLGTNESIEAFPVGRVLAFDAERGRLWIVCPDCARWNLTPLEERWEAVEDCERRFRGMRLRAQTANIGYAKLADGTGLVRIGKPLRPEFAAWRYGREFSRRRVRTLTMLGAASLLVAGVAAGSVYVGAAAILPQLGVYGFHAYRSLASPSLEFGLPRGPGREWTVSTGDTMILPDPEFGWRLSIRHHFGRSEHRGPEGERLLATILAHVNHAGGSDHLVQAAVSDIQEHSKADLLRAVAARSEDFWVVDSRRIHAFEKQFMPNERNRPDNRAGLAMIKPVRRLAIEMALHEQTEQRALDGELAALEASWREAEEIAGIADNLLLPRGVDEFIGKHRPVSS